MAVFNRGNRKSSRNIKKDDGITVDELRKKLTEESNVHGGEVDSNTLDSSIVSLRDNKAETSLDYDQEKPIKPPIEKRVDATENQELGVTQEKFYETNFPETNFPETNSSNNDLIVNPKPFTQSVNTGDHTENVLDNKLIVINEPDENDTKFESVDSLPRVEESLSLVGEGEGPYDYKQVDKDAIDSRLNLGSIFVPMVEGTTIGLEFDKENNPIKFYYMADEWKISLKAFATPKGENRWQQVLKESAAMLKKDRAEVNQVTGKWGEEILAKFTGMQEYTRMAYIGVDGPRWLLKCMVASKTNVETDFLEVVNIARSVVSQTIVKRDKYARPNLEPLPLVLSPELIKVLLGEAMPKKNYEDEDDEF